jgi:uncharacterized protein YqfA (UPF0365 family)
VCAARATDISLTPTIAPAASVAGIDGCEAVQASVMRPVAMTLIIELDAARAGGVETQV